MCHAEGEEKYRRWQNGSGHLGSSRSAPAFAIWLYDSGTRPLRKRIKYKTFLGCRSPTVDKQSRHYTICDTISKLKKQ